MQSMKVTNQRKFSRHQLINYLNVFKYDTNEPLGYLVDISLGGGMLVNNMPIPIGEKFKILIVLPTDFPSESYFDIEIESVRECQDLIDNKQYNTGFRFFNINSQQQEIIAYIINKYVF
jgi:c-di-GMP-binding flagellar brake protein YcgR